MITSQYKNKRKSKLIEVEDVLLAEKLVQEVSSEDLCRKFSNRIEHIGQLPNMMVDMGTHSFLAGMYLAYSEHRPFTVSPEMIWLLILQGVSAHFNYNSKAVLKYYPHLKNKKELEIINNKVHLGDVDSPWNETISSLVEEMKVYTDEEFLQNLRPDFSQTSLVEREVCDLMLMHAMKPYFRYAVAICICGIPSIQLEGEESDWDEILTRLDYIKKFDLSWWIEEIKPLILKIKDSYRKEISVDFWRNMFKIHTKEEYGNPKVIDGWITKFYPYDIKGNKILSTELSGLDVESIFEILPNEIQIIDFIHRVKGVSGEIIKETPMEYWAGFLGLTQDEETFCLRPEMGWFVSHRTERKPKDFPYGGCEDTSREYFALEDFPEELLDGRDYGELMLHYKEDIKYPENIDDLSVGLLFMNGKISEVNKRDLKSRFQNKKTNLIINHEWDSDGVI